MPDSPFMPLCSAARRRAWSGAPLVVVAGLGLAACQSGPASSLFPPDIEGARSTPAAAYPDLNVVPSRPGQPKSQQEVREIERELEELRDRQRDDS